MDDLKDAHWLDAYPNPENNFKQLVVDTGNLIDKSVDNLKISKKFNNLKKTKKETKPPSKIEIDESSKDFTRHYGMGSSFKKIIIAIAIIFIVALAGVYFATNGFTFLADNQQVVVSGDGSVSLDEKGQSNTLGLVPLTCEMGTHCEFEYKLYDEPANFAKYSINTKYYDGSGNILGETTKSMSDVQRNGDKLTVVDYDSDKEVAGVETTIFDENNNQVYHDKVPS